MFCPDILALKHKSRIVTCQTLLGWPRTTHFSSLIFKPVFEHWTGGEAMPKNRKERQCWLSNTSQQCRRILLRCFRARTSGSAWAIHYQRDMCTYTRTSGTRHVMSCCASFRGGMSSFGFSERAVFLLPNCRCRTPNERTYERLRFRSPPALHPKAVLCHNRAANFPSMKSSQLLLKV